jgi:hypothetical protein
MSIARKPKAVPEAAPEKAVEAVISRGLRPAEDRAPAPEGKTIETTIRFRPPARFLYESMLKAVESRQQTAFTRFSQHDWLLEAIAEKLKRDGFLEGEGS